MLSDEQFIDQLRAELHAGMEVLKPSQELLEAVEALTPEDRRSPHAPRKRWGWLRRRSRPLAIVLAALVIAGSAAAAVVALHGSASQPLAGSMPGAIAPASLAGYGYRIAVTPIPFAGGPPGWQPWIVYNRPGTSGPGVPGAMLPTTPILGVGNPAGVPRGKGFVYGESVLFVLTSPQVWAVRIGSRTIRTVSSRYLPTGDRAAVFFANPNNGPLPWLPGLPGEQPRMKNQRIMLPLDRSGRVIATHLVTPPNEGPTLTWMAADASTRWWPLQFGAVPPAPERHERTHPAPGVCELAQHGFPALQAQWGHTVPWISPVHDALGEEFLSCLDAGYYLHGWPFYVAVLLDGHQPGQVLGPIPGARPVPGQPETVSLALPSSSLTRNFGVAAKRVGNAWLVVNGGSGLAQRLQVLNALRISKLDLHHHASRPASGK